MIKENTGIRPNTSCCWEPNSCCEGAAFRPGLTGKQAGEVDHEPPILTHDSSGLIVNPTENSTAGGGLEKLALLLNTINTAQCKAALCPIRTTTTHRLSKPVNGLISLLSEMKSWRQVGANETVTSLLMKDDLKSQCGLEPGQVPRKRKHSKVSRERG